MKSYSKVFKASSVSLVEDVKVISHPLMDRKKRDACGENGNGEAVIDGPVMEQTGSIMARTEEKVRSMEAAAREKINQWWEDNYKKLEILSEEAKQHGYEEGFAIGKREAEEQIRLEYQAKIAQATQLIDQAFKEKEAIIAEAEPFLLELSTAIASQIIKQELTDHPNKFVEVIKQHILRFKEKEYITVCVHPDDYEFIQSQRFSFIEVVNGETEIKIIPDHSVTEKGCIIRTAYGSIDARIDTQMEEIKKVLLEARRREQESGVHS